jgi:hypothetical protein
MAVSGLEHFELRQHAGIADRDRHDLQMRGGVDEDAGAHIEAAHVKAADFRAKLHDMLDTFLRPLEIGAGTTH